MPLVIELPWPDKALSPNARVDRRRTTEIKAIERHAAKMLTLQFMGGLVWRSEQGDIQIDLTFCPPSQQWDRDNALAACKAALDGLAEALGVNDNRFEPMILRRGPVEKGGKVVVRIG